MHTLIEQRNQSPKLWTVGYYSPVTHEWIALSDHTTERAAIARVCVLNGGLAYISEPDPARERFAAAAMSGLLATEDLGDYLPHTIATQAVEYADALIAQLDETEPPA